MFERNRLQKHETQFRKDDKQGSFKKMQEERKVSKAKGDGEGQWRAKALPLQEQMEARKESRGQQAQGTDTAY